MMPINRPLALVALAGATVVLWGGALLATTRDVPRAGAEPGATAAADAAMLGDTTALRTLVRSGANVNTPQGDGMTALHWAADHGDADTAALLLKAGADVRAATRIGAHTPLHIAARSGSAAVVRLLIDAKADVRAVTTTGAAPLHF